MKKIMILGAGIYQFELIKKAKDLGYYTIVCSIEGNYPGFKIADKTYKIDTTNKNEILKVAKKEQISAICTSGTDVAVTTIGYICDKMHLSGISYNNSLKATNKMLMKKAFFENDITTANFYIVDNATDLEKSFYKLNVKKAVIKIVDKSGSRGIKAIDETVDFRKVFDEAIKQTNKNYVIVEEYIYGVEIGIDLFVVNGEISIFCPHDKFVYQHNGIGIPAGHILPFYTSEIVYSNMLSEAKKIVKTYGMQNGAINIDAFIKENGDVYIIEAGARAGATGIPEIVSINVGINYYELIIKAAMGEKILLPNNIDNKPCASLLIYSQKSGKYLGYNYKIIPRIDVSIDYQKGEIIKEIQDGTDRVGIAIISGDTKDDVLDKIEKFKKNFELIVE